MNQSFFDLEQVERNWDLAHRPESIAAPEPIRSVKAPVDTFAVARTDLARLHELMGETVPEQMPTLVKFVERITRALEAVEKASKSGDETAKVPDKELIAMYAELDDAIFDLEDLLEVFTMTQTR